MENVLCSLLFFSFFFLLFLRWYIFWKVVFWKWHSLQLFLCPLISIMLIESPVYTYAFIVSFWSLITVAYFFFLRFLREMTFFFGRFIGSRFYHLFLTFTSNRILQKNFKRLKVDYALLSLHYLTKVIVSNLSNSWCKFKNSE